MKLTPENVEQVLTSCFYEEHEIDRSFSATGTPPAGAVVVQGVFVHVGFHPGRLAAQKSNISSMLEELPREFFIPSSRLNGGGGWSFLNLCMRGPLDPALPEEQQMWTSDHRRSDELLVLALASDLARFCIPDRMLWGVFPGGVPYIEFRLEDDVWPTATTLEDRLARLEVQ